MSASMDSDSESDDAEYSGIKSLPILDQLKRILDEYRNDVQILKELVQNADDAGATELKVLYQGEHITPQFRSKKRKRYGQFLAAPALVFFNDAEFTEDDWEGIMSIYSSVKAKDPLKIGRFGLGFKSIFHLTDYPCIVSGDRLLFLNPDERSPDKVCLTVKLNRIKKWSPGDMCELLQSMNNIFGFSNETIQSGYYRGTLLWFPLRMKPSRLSENICDEDQIKRLLDAFVNESKRSLIFLKTICKVEIYINLPESRQRTSSKSSETSGPPNKRMRSTSGPMLTDNIELICQGKDVPVYTIDINNASGTLIQDKRQFMKEVEALAPEKVPQKTMQWMFNVIISTDLKKAGNTYQTQSKWTILNFLKGGKLNDRTKQLLQDDDLCSHHLVGLAAPLLECDEFRHEYGHVFCYQPLPQESKSVTGLPVHVNAFFALSQNRRDVKWPDENESLIVDKAMEWNLALVNEFLPGAYVAIIAKLVELAESSKFEESMVRAVYNAIPNIKRVDQKWRTLGIKTLQILRNQNFLLTEEKTWISPERAIFAYQDMYPLISEKTWSNVLTFVQKNEPTLISAVKHIIESLEYIPSTSPTYFTPDVLRNHLLTHDKYKDRSYDLKLDLLRFLSVSHDLELLSDIELLPLQNGTFTSFRKRQSHTRTVYLENDVDLFPSQKDVFVAADLDKELFSLITKIRENGIYQIQNLNDDTVVNLIRQTDIEDVHEFGSWIHDIWETLILKRFSKVLYKFKDLEIFPTNFEEGILSDDRNKKQICRLSNLLLKTPDHDKNSDVVCQGFSTMGVKIVKHLPDWLDTHYIREYLHDETAHSLTSLLKKVSDEGLLNYNKLTSAKDKLVMLDFLAVRIETVTDECRKKLKMLELFQVRKSASDGFLTYTSIQSCTRVYIGTDFPVKYPDTVITVSTDAQKRFAEMLGATPMDDKDMTALALDNIQIYDQMETEELCFWLLETRHLIENDTLEEKAKQVPFLDNGDGKPRCICELFDPNDKLLSDLFRDELVFPNTKRLISSIAFDAMKRLGLKQIKDVTEVDLHKTIDMVHEIYKRRGTFDPIKVGALMTFAAENSQLLKNSKCRDKHWILVSCVKSYPESIPLLNRKHKGLCSVDEIKSSEFIHLVGSVTHVHDCQNMNALCKMFDWNEKPRLEDVLKHLSNVIDHYDGKCKVESLQMITDIYRYLTHQITSNDRSDVDDLKSKWKTTFPENGKCVWNGDGFSPIDMVYVQKEEGDISLKPYILLLPDELAEMKQLFTSVGCMKTLGLTAYLTTLVKIKQDSDNGIPPATVKGFLRMTIDILNKLKLDFQATIKNTNMREHLYIPIQQDNASVLILKHITKCTVGNADDTSWNMNDEETNDEDVLYFVHEDVPPSTAESLGVLSLKQQMISDADAFEECGQDEPLTTRLNGLLRYGYKDGFSIAKELLQNADDAGATQMHILYDERRNEGARSLLINEGLAEWQGPALWIFNDAEFSDEDFKNITKLNGGTKEDDSTKIGKFGLGFCAVYNLTDVPSFVSGEHFVIFDPHTTFIGKALPGKSPGLRLNIRKLKQTKKMRRLQHQFQVFGKIFDCNILNEDPDFYFKGTLFRLPLRLRGSEISQQVYTHKEVVRLLQMIVEMAPNMFVFNQNVAEMKVFHLKDETSNITELYHVRKESYNLLQTQPRISSVLMEATKRKQNNELFSKPLSLLQNVRIFASQCLNARLCLKEGKTHCQWLVAWMTGTDGRTRALSQEKGALPVGSVAVIVHRQEDDTTISKMEHIPLCNAPNGFYKEGHFFFFLPLPVTHSFPFHINSQFNVKPDRSALITSTSDEKVPKLAVWNECIMTDVTVKALLYMLENGYRIQTNSPYVMWPVVEKTNVEKMFRDSFYSHITSEMKYKIFSKQGRQFTLNEVIFLDPNLRLHENVGDIAFEFLSAFVQDTTLINIPSEILQLLANSNSKLMESKIVSPKQFIMQYFLPNVHSVQMLMEKRDAVLQYVLLFRDKDVEKWIRTHPCIPVQPIGSLKQVNSLIDPEARFANLFKDDDCRFPIATFSNDKDSIDRLREIGMIHKVLPDELIIDRAKSVPKYNTTCSECAMKQCESFVDYLSKDKSVNVFEDLKSISFLPIQMKPTDWRFRWKGDSEVQSPNVKCCSEHRPTQNGTFLQEPQKLFRYSCQNLVGCIELVVDQPVDALLSRESLYHKLGVCCPTEDDYSISLVVKQLQIMSESHQPELDRRDDSTIKRVEAVYKHLGNAYYNNKNCSSLVRSLKNESVVLVGDAFVCARNIAKNQEVDCQPHLYKLGDSTLQRYPSLCKCLEIRDSFDPEDVANFLQHLYSVKRGRSLTNSEFIQCIKLLQCLVELLRSLKRTWREIITGEIKAIYIPDENMVLRESVDLCFNDFDDIEKGDDMIYVHGDIPPNYAKLVGVEKKTIKHFEDNSDDIVDFYQDEPLITRLKRLVEGYPCDVGIFKELLQNADDAGAHEIHFIQDNSTHPTENILNESFAPLQGPALCVYNDSSFTQKDLQGIQRLGRGSKDDDPSKTGRYGVGFNAVYNLTDAPSFLTKGNEIENGETLCFFDPIAKFVPLVTKQKPGRRMKNVEKCLRNHHSDLLSGYHERHYFETGKGTMFRFPLRTQASEIKDEHIEVEELTKLLNTFAEELPDIMIFLKHLRKICITRLDKGRWSDVTHVTTKMTEKDQERRHMFTQDWGNLCKDYKSSDARETVFTRPQKLTDYDVSIKQRKQSRTTCFSYHIVQVVGFNSMSKPQDVITSGVIKGKIGLLPQGAVAYRIEKHQTAEANKVYCFLPLPVESGLPVHIHGYFALDHESRRSLWTESNADTCTDVRSLWNQYIIESVISPAYVTLLETMKDRLTGTYHNSKHPYVAVKRAVRSFVNVFPQKGLAKGPYWELLVKHVYKEFVGRNKAFLPVMTKEITISCKRSQRQKEMLCSLTWEPLVVDDYSLNAYHSDESETVENFGKSRFNNILRSIGLRIVSVDDGIRESMTFAEVGIENISPRTVIDFLRRNNAEFKDTCRIEKENHVCRTVLQTVSNVGELLTYILRAGDYFDNNLEHLPVIVTADNIIRSLHGKTHLFVSAFTDLFPSTTAQFLHPFIAETIRLDMREYQSRSKGTLKDFTMSDLVEIAMETGWIAVNQDGFVKYDESNFQNNWLARFWKFFRHRMDCESRLDLFQKDVVFMLTQSIRPLSIILLDDPIRDICFLCNTNQLFILLNVESFPEYLQQILTRLKIPVLNKSYMLEHMHISKNPQHMQIIMNPQYTENSLTMVHSFEMQIPNFTTPWTVIDCFYFNRDRIEVAELLPSESEAILRYFNDNLPRQFSVEKLKGIPLFMSIDGRRRCLNTFQNFYLVPRSLPTDGISHIIRDRNILLVKEDETLKILYERIGFGKMSWIDVYILHIFPSQHLMERNEFYEHIKFLAKRLTPDCELYDTVITRLKMIPFIKTLRGDLVQVGKLFDHKHRLFKIMCKPEEFLPENLRTSDQLVTLHFFKQLGLKHKMDLQLFERFANEIAMKENERIFNDEVSLQSEMLVRELMRMGMSFFKDKSFENLAGIHFVKPRQPEDEYIKICEQNTPTTLIPFKGSIVPSVFEICWTSSPILPDYAVPHCPSEDMIRSKLHIALYPTPDQWIEHVNNVGTSLSNKLMNCSLDMTVVENVVEKIYESIDKIQVGNVKDKVKTTPLIFFSTKQLVVPAKNCVNNCKETSDEIPPYLMKTPIKYGKYFSSFTTLGVHDETSASVYAPVLCDIQSGNEAGKMLPKEKLDAIKAMHMMCRTITPTSGIDTLFLPCTDGTISRANTTIVNDNDTLKERVCKGASPRFVSGFSNCKNCGVKRDELVASVKLLPKDIRPHFLTDLIEEHVDLTQIVPLERRQAYHIKEHIRSCSFMQCFIRLAKHSRKEASKVWNSAIENEIKTHLSNIEVSHVTGIRTNLKMFRLTNGKKDTLQDLSNTSERKSIHIECKDGTTNVFFENEGNTWYEDLRENLSLFLNNKFELCLRDKLLFLLNKLLIHTEASLCSLSELLDKANIEMYHSTDVSAEPIYPVPGKFVPKELHKYLDNDYGMIQEFDYRFMALLLEDPLETDENKPSGNRSKDTSPTYIFVHVLGKTTGIESSQPLFQEYEVDTGEESTATVAAYLLFKFVRKKSEELSKGTEVVLYNAEDASQREHLVDTGKQLKAICQEIRKILIEAWKRTEIEQRRIVRRLLLKWHPDKNPDKIELSTKVFQYIQQCIKMLEKGMDPPEFTDKGYEDPDSGTSQYYGRSNWSSSWYSRYWRGYKRSYGAGFWSSGGTGNFTEGFRSWFRSSSSGSDNSTYEPYHYHSEAQRWQEQARCDLKDARCSLEHGGDHTNNMICFKSHQAAEKSLKAAWYAKDANKIRSVKYSHQLCSIASGLHVELQRPVSEIQNITGDHTRMRYPDTMQGTIPARAYTEQNARGVTRLAEEVMQLVQRHYID